MKLFIATGNRGKVAEIIPFIAEFLGDFVEVVARAPKNADEIEETFLGNARIKAEALRQELIAEGEAIPFAVLADDSGLEVVALDNAPGVHSARYAGDHGGSEKNIEKLLHAMQGIRERHCRYVCCLVLLTQEAVGKKSERSGEGYCEGEIMEQAQGRGGFGYDPIFWVPSLAKRMSETTLVEKNSLSHRRHAFEELTKSD